MRGRAIGLAWGAVLALACAPAAPPAQNLILVSIDTLRPDLLGAYGYPRPTSPVLDAVAARGTLFEVAVSPAPWTLPAHASLLTGLYEARHGLESHDLRLADDTPTLAEILRGHGFATAAIVNSKNLSDRHGLHRGFEDHFYVVESEGRVEPSEVERLAVEWLSQPREGRFFLFLHYYDVHSDYRATPGYLQAFVRPGEASADGSTHQLRRFRDGEIALDAGDARRLEDLYAAGIRQMDDGIARLLAALRDAGHADDTLLVVTSDHGEELLEHGGVLHGRTQYDEVLRVPLMLSGPRVPEGLRVADPASLIDVVPTALSLLGLPARDGFDGIDLAPALRGDALPRRLLFGEADHGRDAPGTTRSVRDGRLKAILDLTTGVVRIFDLADDPGETRPLALDGDADAMRLRRALEAFVAAEQTPDPSRRLAPLTDDEVERLRALGYF